MRSVLINGTIMSGFTTIPDCAVFIEEDGTIGDFFNMSRLKEKDFPSDTVVIDVQGSYIMPGFIDSHLHGIGGYGTEDCSTEAILGMSERLADYGVTTFMPTIYTDRLEKMLAGEEAIVGAIGQEKGAKIAGIHLEGPFISPDRIGAQAPEGLQKVDLEVFQQLLDAGHGHVLAMTCAPELKGMRQLALAARKANITLLAGHTNATYEQIIEGMQCGILHSTHFFNAMSRLHHRNPGTVGAIMIQKDMKCEIICDGVHVHPELVKLLLREKPVSNVVMITDSLRPTKQRTGELTANGEPCVLKDGAFVSARDNNLFVGSALTMLQGFRNLVSWGVPMESAVQMGSANPARVYNLDRVGMIIPGYKANLTILDKNLQLRGVFIDGNLIRDRLS